MTMDISEGVQCDTLNGQQDVQHSLRRGKITHYQGRTVCVSLMVLVVMLHMVSPVSGEEKLEWGDHPDLVMPEIVTESNKHSKLLVVFVGETVDLTCKVLFTSQPVSDIKCYGNGRRIMKPENHTVETQDRYTFIKDTFKIGNITEEMDQTAVTCEYSKGWFSGRILAIVNAFKLEIETSEEVCERCDGDVKLVFKECNTGPDNSNIAERIPIKIAEMMAIKPEDITLDSSGYSVNLPIATVMANQAILNIKHKFFIDGTVTDTLTQCKSKCESADWWICRIVIIILIPAMGIASLVVWLKCQEVDQPSSRDVQDQTASTPNIEVVVVELGEVATNEIGYSIMGRINDTLWNCDNKRFTSSVREGPGSSSYISVQTADYTTSDVFAHAVTNGSDVSSHVVTNGSDDSSHAVTNALDDSSHVVTNGTDDSSHAVTNGTDDSSHAVTNGTDDSSHVVTNGSDDSSRVVTNGSDDSSHVVTSGTDDSSHAGINVSDDSSHAVTKGCGNMWCGNIPATVDVPAQGCGCSTNMATDYLTALLSRDHTIMADIPKPLSKNELVKEPGNKQGTAKTEP